MSRWRIRNKLFLGTSLLVVMVCTLAYSSMYALYSYRGLVKSISTRSKELPLAGALKDQISDLRVILSEVRTQQSFPNEHQPGAWLDTQLLREDFRLKRQEIGETLTRYRDRLEKNTGWHDWRIGEDRQERQTLGKIESTLGRIDERNLDSDWLFDELQTGELTGEVEKLDALAAELPSHMHRRMRSLADEVRSKYRTGIGLTWICLVAAVATFGLLLRLFYKWIFHPLRILIAGSRQVAQGRFDHRIHLETQDEMSELAGAMNDMTSRFQAIRDELDCQVRERTKQVVRSEQLASVGFLAAGVAHEINNPLASIAFCSESLESRLTETAAEKDEHHEVISSYLRMIQQEAFRCKEITEKLLDFSRMGEIEHQRTDLRSLVQDVIAMVGHLGRYKEKHVALAEGQPVFAYVNAQEMKQVVLNLITNGLDSLDPGGEVTVTLCKRGVVAELVVADDGCGMTADTLQHIFEPFFTRRRGGQGTGLGLSITYRIIADHDGHIEAASEGPGSGSSFTVTLPLAEHHKKERKNQYQAA